MLVLAVLGSIVGLALGAMIHGLGRGRGRAAIDGFVLGAIPLLIAVRVVPHVYEELGRSAFAFVALGFMALALGDRHAKGGGARVGRVVLIPTLFVHALADGAALALAAGAARHDTHDTHDVYHHDIESIAGRDVLRDAEHAHAVLGAERRWVLVLAIMAHRLPEGLLVCAALVPSLGWKKTLPRLSGIAGATVIGALAGRSLLTIVPDRWLDAVVAFGVGAMLRLAVHSHERAARTARDRWTAGVAFIVGVTSVLMIPDPDSVLARAQPTELSVARSLAPLFIETAPAMALAMLAMLIARLWGVHKSWLTAALFSSGQREGGAWLGRAQQAKRGEGLALWGVFASAALGFDALALSLGWFGPLGASLRWLVAAALPVVWFSARPPEIEQHWREDVADPVRALASNAGWYAVGLLSGAVIEAALAAAVLARWTGLEATIAAVGMGMIVPVPMTAAVPIAAVVVHKGAGVDVALAWLWACALRGALSGAVWLRWIRSSPRAFAARVLLAFAAIVVMARFAERSAWLRFPELHPRLAHEHVPFEWVCVAIATAVLLGILLRLGPRAVLDAMAERRTAHFEVHDSITQHQPPSLEPSAEPPPSSTP